MRRRTRENVSLPVLSSCGIIRSGVGRQRLKFSELVRLLEREGFRLVREKGSVRYYGKAGWSKLIRVDYHGAKEVPTGTCHHILKAAGLR